MYGCMFLGMDECMYVCAYVCMHLWMYVCMYVCMYVWMYVRLVVCMMSMHITTSSVSGLANANNPTVRQP
jgi:hypothetical protein